MITKIRFLLFSIGIFLLNSVENNRLNTQNILALFQVINIFFFFNYFKNVQIFVTSLGVCFGRVSIVVIAFVVHIRTDTVFSGFGSLRLLGYSQIS